MSASHPSIVVLISGNGSNLQAIIDAISQGLEVSINAVISNRTDAYGLVRAQKAGIPTEVVLSKNYSNSQAYDQGLLETIQKYKPDLIVLAGFMRILGPEIVAQYPDKIINIHPSLLPQYPGLHTHQRVLAAKERCHGVSIHFVDNVMDNGPLIAQAAIKIHEDETVESLEERIHKLEHVMYPQVIGQIVKSIPLKN